MPAEAAAERWDEMNQAAIYLWPHEAECYLCQAHIIIHPEIGGHGIPIYEDTILADGDPGEWGGVPVCRPCFDLTRNLQQDGKLATTTQRVRIERTGRLMDAAKALGKGTVLSTSQALTALTRLWRIGLTVEESSEVLKTAPWTFSVEDLAAYLRQVLERKNTGLTP